MTQREGSDEVASPQGGSVPADIARIVKYARREGFGYGVCAGSLASVIIRRLLDWLWP